MHVLYRHARPIKTPSVLFVGTKTHLVSLVLRKDNTFAMSIDEEQVLSGALGSKGIVACRSFSRNFNHMLTNVQ